ncbi:MAG TPA: aldehyde dehydrogenase family protein [Tepidisphaeraceae bacterium]|nr:aldehyde dehydrogenase family protein [Tepidisphaeraceae bacterium]
MAKQPRSKPTRTNGATRTAPAPRVSEGAVSAGNGNGHPHDDDASVATEAGNGSAPAASARLPVLKTYKIYVNGKFPRTESGRYYVLKSPSGSPLANVCLCSRKDFRDAVTAARNAQSSWAAKTAYNRGQILYRIAEMLEGRTAQFVDELSQTGLATSIAKEEVVTSIDRVLYYAGWADKYQQVFSAVNPVSSSHFNFSLLEPTGVVSILAPEETGLIGLISTIIPAIVGGNTCIALASTARPLPAVTLGEVLATSDLPGGVVNLLTGKRPELLEHFATHMDVNACVYAGRDPAELTTVRTASAGNVKRAINYDREDWMTDDAQGPYFILDTQEVKTTWHPVGV